MTKSNVTRGIIKRGEYYDSVSLMKFAGRLKGLPGVIDSAAVMGSEENQKILEAAGLLMDDFAEAADSDLLIAFACEKAEQADKALQAIDALLNSLKETDETNHDILPRTIGDATRVLPGSNLAVISIAGKYAGDEAMNALQAGLHVMLFSDNVPLIKEIELKKYAAHNGLLLMGPDCGTAIINGVPLGFANAVRRGKIGIVAASGTGLQEVSCIIANEGEGVSQAIGTGSRDISGDVGGIMFIEAILALADDPDTEVLLLVSKPPHPDVLDNITLALKNISKPIVAIFLGADIAKLGKYNFEAAESLEEGALKAIALARGKSPVYITEQLKDRENQIIESAKAETKKIASGQKYLRGLFSGGTFGYEAQILLTESILDIYSNAPWGKNHELKNSLKSEKHTLIDMGADEFTVGRLHPMIDFSLRNKRIIEEATDPETAVILLDLVLGYGVVEDALAAITPAIKEAKQIAKANKRYLPIICSVTGTDHDPQSRSEVISGLKELGVIVRESNAAACMLAGYIVKEVGRR